MENRRRPPKFGWRFRVLEGLFVVMFFVFMIWLIS